MDGNASTPYWTVLDGTNNINFRDYDGTLTGRADVQIVDNRPFFTSKIKIALILYGQMLKTGKKGDIANSKFHPRLYFCTDIIKF